MRFAVEVLTAVREAVPDAVVGLRLVGDEEIGARGLGPDDAAEIGARLEAAGLVDFLDVSIGRSGTGMVRPLYVPHGVGVYAAALRGRGPEVVRVGDAVAVRYADRALFDGHVAGRAL